MDHDSWASPDLAGRFVDQAYASAKGFVRTRVLHRQLLEHLPAPPASILDVGGGAGHQSFPLAAAGYRVTVLDSSPAMLERASDRLQRLGDDVQDRVDLLLGDGEDPAAVLGSRQFDAVLCHGVLGYLEEPARMIEQLCRHTVGGGLVSIMTGNAAASAVQPALERRWSDALAALRTAEGTVTNPVPGLEIRGRCDTVAGVSELLARFGAEPVQWYGVWLFVDWLGFGGVSLDTGDAAELEEIAAVEFEAARRDPYRRLSRAFHLLARVAPAPTL